MASASSHSLLRVALGFSLAALLAIPLGFVIGMSPLIYGNENWEFNESGLMMRRFASINDLPIAQGERLFHWPLGRRPVDHPGLDELGL